MSFDAQLPHLLKLGWQEFFRAQLTPVELNTFLIARIVEPARGLSRAACSMGEIWAEASDNVAVGDWVIGTVRGDASGEQRFTVNRVLGRRTKISRQAPSGKNFEQVLCANVDTSFVVVAMTQELKLSGIDRAITAIKAAELLPVLVLTKADACEDKPSVLDPLTQKFPDVMIHMVSVPEQSGMEALDTYLGSGQTVVLIGQSGSGKSTLTNYLLKTEVQLVAATRESDEKGRHTTTSRRMHFLPSGAMLVDSPGIREFQPWVEPEPVVKTGQPKKSRQPKRGTRYEEDDEGGY